MKIDYLELINEIAKYKTGEEIEILRDVYDQLEEAGIEGIKNDRSSWSKLRYYFALYIDTTQLRNLAYTKLLFVDCVKGLQKHLNELEQVYDRILVTGTAEQLSEITGLSKNIIWDRARSLWIDSKGRQFRYVEER